MEHSYLFSDDMFFEAIEKLNDCQSSAHSYMDLFSASVNTLFYANEVGDESAIASASISLADSCLMLNAYDDAETLYSQILLRRFSDPRIEARAYAAAELGLAKICVSTGRDFQAHEHVKSCLVYSESANLPEYNDYIEVVLAEMQYNSKSYDGCTERIARLLPSVSGDDSKTLQWLTLPLLSLRALTEAQRGDYTACEQSTSRLITLADKYDLNNVTSKHLDSLKLVYAQNGQPFPSAFSDELIESYRIISKKNIDFVAEYAIMQLLSFYNKSLSFQNSFTTISFVILIPVLLLLQLIVRLFIRTETDALTGLYNRRRFTVDCRAVARRKADVAFIMFDVDDFKSINDTYGHGVGDVVLSRVAKTMYCRCSSGCRVYRIGGEEFAVIISNANRTPPYTLADSIRAAISELKWRESGLVVTISAGVSVGRGADLYRKADEMLYYSKSHGKNCVS